ncbi:MAG: hypothetical protein BSOLF_0769 [Candidatus Carbobacillus altaicus]|uniref:Uncharacterized protein n=1 Tax=Candidatus Carbonibacillus altaicus TaxID=2163959 RepID=A0A2R6XXC1_9BACL|nr:MAG: hypothetical protein BSOLF_0769 [Candidatus Carbobacillus altaicus]
MEKKPYDKEDIGYSVQVVIVLICRYESDKYGDGYGDVGDHCYDG